MCKKTIICCFVLISAFATLSTPSYATIDVNHSPMTVGWSALNGSPPKIITCTDPNELPSYNEDGGGSGNLRIAENFIGGRGVSQTFTVPASDIGFSVTDIVIRVGGGGSDTVGPYTLHLYDINDPNLDSLPGSYTPATQSSYPGVDFLSDTTGFLGDVALMEFADGDNDELVTFTFSDDDLVDLEPGHMYAFEIWGPENCVDYPFLWIRYGVDNPYDPNGDGYECPASRDNGEGPGPSNPGNYRSQLSGESHDTVMAVYGVPYDGNAYHPTPRNYEKEISLNPILSWKPGKWVDDVDGHQVWFSTSFNRVARRLSAANQGRRTDPNYTPPGPLELDTTYYWRIDEYNDTPTVPVPFHADDGNSYWGVDSEAGVDKPTIYRFTTFTPQAHDPVPATGTTTADFSIKLPEITWTAGALTADTNGHTVYFGTDLDEVNNADTNTPTVYRGRQTPASYNLLDLAGDYTLEVGTTYYWRVDEANDSTAGSPWKGNIWSFTMAPYVTVDAFSYSSQTDMNSAWKAPTTNYCFPECTANPGGTITLDAGKMRFAFDNRGTVACPWSEAKMDYNGTGIDWTAGGIVNTQSLSISVDGNIFSSTNPDYDNLYVAIEDSGGNIGVVYCDDTIIQKRQFDSGRMGNQWNIALAELRDNGTPGPVDLTDINALYIGTGPRCSWGPPPYTYGGTGIIYVDKIRLYMPRCLTQYGGFNDPNEFSGDLAGGPYNQAGNWTPGDCTVNFFDLDYMFYNSTYDTKYWLDSDVNLTYPGAVQPLNDSSHLTVWYKFDTETGTSGTVTATDSSGNNRHGTIGNPNSKLWASDGASGQCLNLEAGLRTWVEVPTSAYHPDTNGVTFSFWTAYDMNYQPTGDYAATWASVFTMHTKTPAEANANNSNDDSQLIESQVPTPWPRNHDWGPQIRYVDMRSSSGENVGRPGPQWARLSDYGKRWNHYAFTYDDINNIKEIYENGVRIGFVEGDVNVPLPVWPAPGSFRLATRSNRYYNPGIGAMGPNWGFWLGKLDEFRVYNYALTEHEIQWLAKNGAASRIVPLLDSANLNRSESTQIINFRDYAKLMQHWLDTELWP
ncbi:MAG: hypothetical protein JW749_10410 [Sedimentisphaerales bacterium]|nr:hypothetical protein [Sedimentisphaerales bacterium]